MIKYMNWGPTEFDRKGLNGEANGVLEFFVVPVIRTRDSRCLELSNFDSALKLLGGESDTVQIHRFGHWACGWIEIILAHPVLESKVKEIEDKLENYPILDEFDYSNKTVDAACENWAHMGLREKIEACARYRVSIFAARRSDIPDSPTGELLDYVVGEI